MDIVFASHNNNKVNEIKYIFKNNNLNINVLSLDEVGIFEDIEENGETLEANALLKTQFVYNKLRINCFSDDTGLEICSLNGLPGVNTARFAGNKKDDNANIAKTLSLLEKIDDRRARFRTAISLNFENNYYAFEGIAEGNIAMSAQGVNGFGYDPIFIPIGYSKSFAQMPNIMKNTISHRYLALQNLIKFLETKMI